MEDARRFAFEEPYWLEGVYASVNVAHFHPVREGTMWDRPPSDADTDSALVLVNWPAQVRASSGGEERQLLGMLAEMDLVVFGGLLTSDDGRHSVGLVAGVDADIGRAAALVTGVAPPRFDTSVTSQRWRRGGRAQW